MFKPVPDQLLKLETKLSKSDLELLHTSLIEALKLLETSDSNEEILKFFNNYADKCKQKIVHLKRVKYEYH